MNSDGDMHGARETLFTYFNANAMHCNAVQSCTNSILENAFEPK